MSCSKCQLPKGLVHRAIPSDPASSSPTSSLAQRQMAELSRLERAELQRFRALAASWPPHSNGGGGVSRAGKGKGKGAGPAKSFAGGGGAPPRDWAPGELRDERATATGADPGLSAADKLKHQGQAQALWKQLRGLHEMGVVDIPTGATVSFPTLPPASSDLPWEERLQRVKNLHNRAWGKLKSSKLREVEAAKLVAELFQALDEAKANEVVAKEAADSASKHFDEAAAQLHEVENEQKEHRANDFDSEDDDMGGTGNGGKGSRRKRHSKPPIPADEADLWSSFKDTMAASVLNAVQSGQPMPDVTATVQLLGAKLLGLMESKARNFAPNSPKPPSVGGGGGSENPTERPSPAGAAGVGVTGAASSDGTGTGSDPLDPTSNRQADEASPSIPSMGGGRGHRGRAFSRSRSREGTLREEEESAG